MTCVKIKSLYPRKEIIVPNSVPSREAIFAVEERDHISARYLNRLGSSIVFHAHKTKSYNDDKTIKKMFPGSIL